MEMEHFFAALGSRLAEARRADRRRHGRFFSELVPRLDAARSLDRELDRQLAWRFNVFDYLRTDELGLSRVIADLLDPRASHGQGTLFLRSFLERLGGLPLCCDLDECRVSVAAEHRIPSGRIDLVVRIGMPDGEAFCLAVENKPFAPDKNNQIKDYLKHLKDKYVERFLLLYLSPTGEGPSEQSVAPRDLEACWKGRFGIVPYHRAEEPRSDMFDDFRFSFSLTDWLEECRTRCEVDRLRWFLHDVGLFCKKTFGDRAMTSDSESGAVREFVLSSPDNLVVAQAVYESWPAIRNEVYERFLKRLKKKNRGQDEGIHCWDPYRLWKWKRELGFAVS